MEVEFGFERVVLFEKGDVFGCLISYWFLLLFLYILIKGCLLMKLCQREILLVARNYRNIANLEYRNRLLGRVSKCILHDITTPISVISGYLKLSNDNDEQFKLKKSALGSLLYLEMLLNGSMNIVKKQSEHNYFATNISLLEMLEILRRRIEKSNIKLNLYLSGDCNIKGDKCLFCRIFLNLLVNAIEELEVSRKKERIIDIKSSVEDGYYVMNIKDNGRGLSKEFLEKLDSKNIDLGYEDDMGIGLFFVCITMRREFKGDIKYRSVKWKYTNVELKFPL